MDDVAEKREEKKAAKGHNASLLFVDDDDSTELELETFLTRSLDK